MEIPPKIVIEAGTDIAMVGLWDVDPSRGPFERHPSIDALEAEAREGKLFYVSTGADGSFETWIWVEQEIPAEIVANTLPRGELFGLEVPTGTLCCGGVEDFRSRRKQITGNGDRFEVSPGTYSVRCRVVDIEIPRRRLAEHLGEEEFAIWLAYEKTTGRACLLVLIGMVAAGFVGAWVDWWLALGIVAAFVVGWVLFEKFSDPQGQKVERKVMEFTGDRTVEELEEEFAEANPTIALELRRVEEGAMPPGGFIELWPRS